MAIFAFRTRTNAHALTANRKKGENSLFFRLGFNFFQVTLSSFAQSISCLHAHIRMEHAPNAETFDWQYCAEKI